MRPYESDDGRAFTSLFLGAKSELAMSMALVPDILTMPMAPPAGVAIAQIVSLVLMIVIQIKNVRILSCEITVCRGQF